jgi:hypothetical protein
MQSVMFVMKYSMIKHLFLKGRFSNTFKMAIIYQANVLIIINGVNQYYQRTLKK